MQLRTFFAQNMKEALACVRAEMGSESVILSTETSADGGVLVRAALEDVDFREENSASFDTGEKIAFHQTQPESKDLAMSAAGVGTSFALSRQVAVSKGRAAPRPTRPHAPMMDTRGQAGKADVMNAQVSALRQKCERRRFDRGELLALFAHHRLPDSLAHQLAEHCAGTGINDMTLALAAAIDARMLPAPIDFSAAKAFLLLGLGGTGKTATAAKLAAHAQLSGRRVRLIAGDAEGAGAVARLQAFAEHLNAEIVVAATPTQIAQKTRDAIADGTLAIIDTAGFDPRQADAAGPLLPLTKSLFLDTIGIVSAMTDSEEMLDITAALRRLGASRLIVTQVDLVRRLGAVATAALADAIGFAHTTSSPFVAGGLETPTPLSLARQLVENKKESVQ